MKDMHEAFAEIQAREAKRRIEREAQAANNRARMRQWSPEFYALVEQLEACGMFGKVVSFHVERQEAA